MDESLKALGLEKHQALIVAPVHLAQLSVKRNELGPAARLAGVASRAEPSRIPGHDTPGYLRGRPGAVTGPRRVCSARLP